MPTQRSRNSTPKPENIAATREISNSLNMSLVNFVLVTSYTKNHAVKNTPIPSNTTANSGNTAGFMGETYLVIDSISTIVSNKYFDVARAMDT